jgi:hypothetical protein
MEALKEIHEKPNIFQEKIADMEQAIRNWKTVLLDFEKGLRYSMRKKTI